MMTIGIFCISGRYFPSGEAVKKIIEMAKAGAKEAEEGPSWKVDMAK